MNLSDFERTEFTGLYKSINAHPTFGKKYVARFQLNKKRYMKVIGYDKKDNLTDLKAFSLLEEYKELVGNKSARKKLQKEKETSKKVYQKKRLSIKNRLKLKTVKIVKTNLTN